MKDMRSYQTLNMLDIRKKNQNYKFYSRIQEREVQEALKRMSYDKVVGPGNIPIEMWKSLRDGELCGSPNFLTRL